MAQPRPLCGGDGSREKEGKGARNAHAPPKLPEPIFFPRRYLRPTRSSIAIVFSGGAAGASSSAMAAPLWSSASTAKKVERRRES
jgi:hypothetical protein